MADATINYYVYLTTFTNLAIVITIFIIDSICNYHRLEESDPKRPASIRKVNRVRLCSCPKARYCHLWKGGKRKGKRHRRLFPKPGFRSFLKQGQFPPSLRDIRDLNAPCQLTYWHILSWKLFMLSVKIETWYRCSCINFRCLLGTVLLPLLCPFSSTITYVAHSAFKAYHSTRTHFDTDSMPIGVDCHASCTMSSQKECFQDLKLKDMGQVGGISNGLKVEGVGTFKFHLTDDQGITHQIKIPNSLYVPGLKLTLLSPQHWAQQVRDDVPCPNGTGASLNGTKVVLYWNQQKHSATVTYDPSTNTPTIRSTPGHFNY